MSLPSELRTICHLLSTTEPTRLPYITPILLKNVICCGDVLSAGDENAKKSDASESLVLVHRFKTQITTLLNGKLPGERFAAVVLIKAVVEVGRWEILRGCESWVKGLLSVLSKPDIAAVKSICILTLASIYALARQYQTLVREITTPTLPTFVSSCLNLVPKSCANLNGQEELIGTVFEAFATLISHHPTVFRPFASQIRMTTRLYIAPTISDGSFVAPSLRESAGRLHVIVHQTAPKNTASDEWARALRFHIKTSHATADRVFRAVVEDWESVAGYINDQIDVNAALHGGSDTIEDFPPWSGIFAGVERLTGVIAFLEHYLRSSTDAAVTIPVASVVDLITRLLSIAKPNRLTRGSGSVRINPAIDRDEREGMWAGLPQIHAASMKLLIAVVDRLQAHFLPFSQGCLDQIVWLFPFSHSNEEFRMIAYKIVASLLGCGGPVLPKDSVLKLSAVILACCHDILPEQAKSAKLPTQKEGVTKGISNGSNADDFLKSNVTAAADSPKHTYELTVAANQLLPLFLSHLPQAHLQVSLRSQIDRTAIITQHKDAMIASVLHPFTVNGRTLPSILPHLSRLYPDTPAVEALLRPRFPPLPASHQDPELLDLIEVPRMSSSDDFKGQCSNLENTLVDVISGPSPASPILQTLPTDFTSSTTTRDKLTTPKRTLSDMLSEPSADPWGASPSMAAPLAKRGRITTEASSTQATHHTLILPVETNASLTNANHIVMGNMEEDSDDESVPSLKMEFDGSDEE